MATFTPTLELITSPHMPHSLNIPPTPPLFPPFNNRILNKTYKKCKYIMHFKKGILGIWLKYNVIPPRYYTVPNYGIQIQGSIHVLLPNWWIVILIPLQFILFLVILIPITV